MIEAFQKKDYQRFDEFYELTSKHVFFTLKKYIKDPMMVEDLMQETFIKFLKSIHLVKPNLEVKSYITTIARNLAIDHLRKQRPIEYDDAVLDLIIDPYQVEKDWLHVLDVLDHINKDIVYLHVIESMTFKDIAILHQMPLGTVLWRYQKAMKLLKEAYLHETQG